jgi:amino acid transporter
MVNKTDIKRTIGFWSATGIGVGAIVGGGILALAGIAFSVAGPSAIIAFALNGCIAFITAVSYAEMSKTFSESGGAYTFTKKIFSVRSAFAIGWILWFASIMAGVLYALGFAFYGISAFQSIWQIFSGNIPSWISGRPMIIILSLGATSFYTIKLSHKSGTGSQWETVGKVIVFCLLIMGGLWLLPRQPSDIFYKTLSPFWAGGILGIFQAMGYTFITLQGFDLIAAVAGEVQNPEKNIPLSMFISLGIAIIIYLPFLFIIATIGVPTGQNIASLSLIYTETVVAVAVRNYLGPVGYWLIIIAALLSMLSALYANILSSSRIALAMSQDRTLPRFLGTVNKDSGIPIRAIYASGFIIILSIIVIPDLPTAGAAASLVFLISFALVHVTNILARLRGGLEKAIFHKSKFPVIPILGIIFCGSLIIFQGISVPAASKTVSIWLVIGFILYFTILSGRAEVVDALTEARDPGLVKMRGQSPLVLIPMANPSRAKAMVEVANALSPPNVGRALLLFIVSGGIDWNLDSPPPQLLGTQEVLNEALIASYRSDLSPEALVTVAPDPWSEIIRVARIHRCKSLLIGIGDLVYNKINPYLNEIMSNVDCDTVFLKSPPDWQLSKAKRILVPVGGKGAHDELRARLLGSLCRSSEREVTFLQIVPSKTPKGDLKWIHYKLSRFAGDEVPIEPNVVVIRKNNVIDGVKEYAAQNDLVILGIQRIGRRKKVFSDVAMEIARATPGATILISRRG